MRKPDNVTGLTRPDRVWSICPGKGDWVKAPCAGEPVHVSDTVDVRSTT